jgi:D-alanyl-D-alanine carboxypeptidase/D-alanyl-D-alanine-endopeptidase (penicillin-binding protein 4)
VARFAVIALSFLLSGCSARAAYLQQPPAPARTASSGSHEQLVHDLDQLFNTPAYEHAQWAASVDSLRTGESLYRLYPSRLLLPASTQKLLTAAAAAERLGWNYRFTTRIVATAPISAGTIAGDLVIVGNGDPTINPRHPARWRVFDEWAAALQAKGVAVVTGQLIGDDNAFAEPGWGMGWSWDDLRFGYGAPVGALQYNENQIDVVVAPGIAAGTPALVTTSPADSGMFLEQSVTTAAPGTEARVELARVPGTMLLRVQGQVAADSKPVSVTAAAENPTRLYLNAFREALGRHGIFVSGRTTDVDELTAPINRDAAIDLIVDRSPPLSEVIDVTLKWSRNVYAETLLFAMAPAGEPATDAKGLEALRETVTAWGVAPESYVSRDGSGLSRYDYVTSDALVRLLMSVFKNPAHAATFRDTLPVAGLSGSLANRLRGTSAEARVWAKTGSMSNVRTLAGYLLTLEGEPLVFSILVNNYRGPSAEVEAVIDKAVVRLVEFRR